MDPLDVEQEVALLLEGLVALIALERIRRCVVSGRRCRRRRLGGGGYYGLRPVVEGILLLVEELGRDLVRLLLRLLKVQEKLCVLAHPPLKYLLTLLLPLDDSRCR